MKKTLTSTLFLLFIHLVFAQPDVEVIQLVNGLSRPVEIKHAGDERLFVLEQEGTIRIIDENGSLLTAPFLDIESLVTNIGGIGDERGLLGLAFHPDYSNNGFFYVYYTNLSSNTVIARYSVDPSNANNALENSASIILTINQPFTNHNGGNMHFGADGYLYIASGDGGSGGDPGNRAQTLTNLLGKILRIDVDGGSPYAIPTDNPFPNAGNPSALPEIWAYGLRNPWKMSFDRTTNDLWIGDVGQGEFEEINRAGLSEAGLNYGWRCYEASDPFNTNGCPADNTLTFPVGEYSHFTGAFKCSVTGGYRYRGSAFPNFNGLYFFADYCSGEIGYLEDNGTGWDLTLETVSSGDSWSSFGEDVNGELYLADLNSGVIYSVVDNNLSIEEEQLITFKIHPNPAKNNVTIEFTKVPLEVTVHNINGQLIQTISSFSSQDMILDTTAYKSGIFFLTATFDNGNVQRKKLVVN